MQRIPEPELMDDPAQAEAYARADFALPNQLFCEQLQARLALPQQPRVLDLGCGPAEIPVRLSRLYPDMRITAVDGSAAMLEHARRSVEEAALEERVELVMGCLGGLALPEHAFDAVVSNSLLHHLHDPELLWREVWLRARPGAGVLVMDLCRPADERAVEQLLAQYASDEPPLLQRDFAASLRAAFTPDEVTAQLAQAGLRELAVELVSDRHLLVYGRA